MTVVRRTIWLTDDEWARLNERARREGVNTSNLIRTLVGAAPVRLGRDGATRPTSGAGSRTGDTK